MMPRVTGPQMTPAAGGLPRQGGSPTLPDRLTRLARVTSALGAATSFEEISTTVVTEGAAAVDATLAVLTELSEDGTRVRRLGLSGGRDADAAWSDYAATDQTPTTDVVRSGARVVVTGTEAIRDRYPRLHLAERGGQRVIALPLRAGTRVVGALSLLFCSIRELDSAELDFLDILADAITQALERVTAQAAAASQSAKLAFLADAAIELAGSLDYEATLTRVAHLAVPMFADWCAIDLVDDGRLRRLAVAHVDPAKVQLAHELVERYPADPAASNGPWQVIRTGRSELIAEVTEAMLVAGAVDEEHLTIARDLRLRSILTVPLTVRDRVLGVLTWVAAESGRHYSADDVSLAEDLAKRAAVAIDNADLHSQTAAVSVRLQRAVLPAKLPVVAGWDVAVLYSPSGRTEVGGDF
jgi:GAF domain-containing protein